MAPFGSSAAVRWCSVTGGFVRRRTRIFCSTTPNAALIDDAGFGEALEAAQAELDPLGLYITHIFGPEQEILAPSWRDRCKQVQLDGLKNLDVWVLGAVDLVLTKLGRGDEGDFADIRFLLETKQVAPNELRDALAHAQVPDELSELFGVARSKLELLLSGTTD